MQKFVVKKSKSAPLAPTSLSQPLPTIMSSAEKTMPLNASTAKLNSTETSAPNESNVTAKQPTNQSATPSPTSLAHVKMSGYLKKKRNKMGGWRKLWFVLQNQLLLSYSSKDDYEKKLAPFKDVLNLVPGTVVRPEPTKGPRFTIETSTNLIYTYRCDNNKDMNCWITALVESLGLQPNDYKQASSKLHYSMENLSKTRASSSSASPASSFMSSRSCDSIYRSQKAKINPKLPVAQNTARVLQRTQDTQSNKKSINTKKETVTQQVQNFRLHPNESHGNQSFEVHQINRMFNTGAIISNNNKNVVNTANGNLVNSPRKSTRNEYSRRRHHHHHHHHRIREVQEMSKDNHICAINLKTGNSCLDKNSNRHSITIMDAEPKQRFENGNFTLAEQIHRISLENDKNSNLHAACVQKTTVNSSIASPSLSCSSSMSSGSSGVSNASTASASKFQLLTAPKNQNTQHNTDSINIEPIRNEGGEPIYAVVNLKDKYEHRAKKKTLDEHIFDTDLIQQRRGRERPNSFHVVSGDYEEVLQLSADCVDGCDDIDEENIYEPINIPELSTKGPLWRYFSKINLDTLVEIAGWKKEQQQHQQQQQQSNGKDETSTFADLRKRFGQHRKSIKNRVKKLYNRTNSCEEHGQAHTNGNGIDINHLNEHNASGSSSGDSGNRIGPKTDGFSGYFNKRDRHLFSSMLKKSRTSLTFDEIARKKIINLAAIGGKNGTKHKPTHNHLEKNGCHSKFYD
ncbi:uncharacterized protein LOC116344790 [Contarinia nasturtii]|uniref:uncharacterized protein LOC116344790 n=1 Tax=Contarinia nasturtii TaxID=265458 RepID=UPI0012D4228A|nr:uncharacterized protein LOC116344790 [Contarinia nasturtii]XP_031629395.1 uncharacterized protein LOC116344790 [Contarinia nasturtii]XP_031629396.1 uncharacterized protein LOC116344790 [Contarinia nasturtii]